MKDFVLLIKKKNQSLLVNLVSNLSRFNYTKISLINYLIRNVFEKEYFYTEISRVDGSTIKKIRTFQETC